MWSEHAILSQCDKSDSTMTLFTWVSQLNINIFAPYYFYPFTGIL